jgi:hypothetical protein
MNDFRVLVTGARVVSPRVVVVVQGECPYGGVDLVAKKWAEGSPGVASEGHPAEWDRLGRRAGPVRNAHMVSLGADVCLAFPAKGSRGTWDCLQRAVDAGIPSHLYPLHIREDDEREGEMPI